MGAVLASIEGFSPLSVIKSGIHDTCVYALNSCRSECDCCGGCLHWIIQTNETHDDADDGANLNITWANK